MKAANLYYNQELMAMATNLYYHCWFARSRPGCLVHLLMWVSPSVGLVVDRSSAGFTFASANSPRP
jgi:hypothetical protein